MYDQAFVQKLKQTNVSADAEKTKERVAALWKASSREAKKEVETLADISRASIYRVFSTGSLSVKLALPMAQVLGADPYYLLGKTDENNGCDDELLARFLSDHGYEKLLQTVKPKAKRKPRAVPVSEPVAAPVALQEQDSVGLPAPTPELLAYLDERTDEDLFMLLKSLLLRAEVDESARQKATLLKLILIS